MASLCRGIVLLVLSCLSHVHGEILRFTTISKGLKSAKGRARSIRAVLRSEDKFRSFWNEHMTCNALFSPSSSFMLPTVNFTKYMIVANIPGSKREFHFESDILRIDELSDEIVVSYVAKNRLFQGGIFVPYQHTFEYVLIKRSDKLVRFQRVTLAELAETGFSIEGTPKADGRSCQSLLTIGSSPTTIGSVCLDGYEGNFNFTITVTKDKCTLTESHVCNMPTEKFKSKAEKTEFSFIMNVCKFPSETGVLTGHVVVECDESAENESKRLLMQNMRPRSQKNKKNIYAAFFEKEFGCSYGFEKRIDGGTFQDKNCRGNGK